MNSELETRGEVQGEKLEKSGVLVLGGPRHNKRRADDGLLRWIHEADDGQHIYLRTVLTLCSTRANGLPPGMRVKEIAYVYFGKLEDFELNSELTTKTRG